MTVAGGPDGVFTAAAVEAIFRSTGGNPLQINNLCDRALLTAYTTERRQVEPAIIEESAVELGFALDANLRIGDDAIRMVDDEAGSDGRGQSLETREPRRLRVRFFVLALVGAAVVILLQMHVFHPTDAGQVAKREQALSTFEAYQQRFEASEGVDTTAE